MSFYPTLFEAEEEEILNIPSIELKKYVGKTSSKVKSDPVNDQILKVDDKTRDDIITWEFVKKAGGNLKKFLREYLTEAGYDVDDNLLRFKKNQPTDELSVTFGEYWDYQVDLLKYDLGQKDESPEEEKEDTGEVVDVVKIDDVFDISKELLSFYRDKGKEGEFTEWLSNIPSNSKIVFGVNLLMDLLHRLVTNTTVKPLDIKKVVKNKNLQVTSIDKAAQDRWKLDMIEYVGHYDDPGTVNDIYIKKILKHGEFLNALFMLEDQGVGRGELLMTYLISGSTFPGGGESYDLLITEGNTYELKDYSNIEKSGKGAIDSIRLGTGGKLTRFEFWKNLEKSIQVAKGISSELDEKDMAKLLDPYLLTLWKYFVSDDNYVKNTKAISSAVSAGEVSDERLRLIKLWFYLVHELVQRGTKVGGKDQYTLAVLKGPNAIPKTVSISPVNSDDLKSGKELTIETEKNVQRALDQLATLKYVKNPDQFQIDMDDVANEYFKHNTDIDYFLVFRPDKINIIGENGFAFAKITQAAVKIIEKEYIRADDTAKKAFDNWKNAIDKAGKLASTEEKKSYDDIKKSLSYKDFFQTEYLGEGFYPKLFN